MNPIPGVVKRAWGFLGQPAFDLYPRRKLVIGGLVVLALMGLGFFLSGDPLGARKAGGDQPAGMVAGVLGVAAMLASMASNEAFNRLMRFWDNSIRHVSSDPQTDQLMRRVLAGVVMDAHGRMNTDTAVGKLDGAAVEALARYIRETPSIVLLMKDGAKVDVLLIAGRALDRSKWKAILHSWLEATPIDRADPELTPYGDEPLSPAAQDHVAGTLADKFAPTMRSAMRRAFVKGDAEWAEIEQELLAGMLASLDDIKGAVGEVKQLQEDIGDKLVSLGQKLDALGGDAKARHEEIMDLLGARLAAASMRRYSNNAGVPFDSVDLSLSRDGEKDRLASRPEQWLEWFEHGNQALVIHGPSGRGKSTAVLGFVRLAQERDGTSLHFWLDCGDDWPEADVLGGLVGQALPQDQSLGRGAGATAAANPEADEDPPTDVERIHALLHAARDRHGASHCYLYLDDLDRAAHLLELPGSFIREFLGALQSIPWLRLVITSKDESVAATVSGIAGDSYGVRSVELDKIKSRQIRGYLLKADAFPGIVDENPGLMEGLVAAIDGEPLDLRLLKDVMLAVAEAWPPAEVTGRQERILEAVAAAGTHKEPVAADPTAGEGVPHGTSPGAPLWSDIRGLLFAEQLHRLPEDAFGLALAISVLGIGYPGRSRADRPALTAVLGRDIDGSWKALKRFRVVTDEYRLDLDAARDYIYHYGRARAQFESDDAEGVTMRPLLDRSVLRKHTETVDDEHLAAAAHYAEIGEPVLEAWHLATGGRSQEAMAAIDRVSPGLELAFRYPDLLWLREAMERRLHGRRDAESTRARAMNEAQLAEIEYQGYDGYSPGGVGASNRAARVVAGYAGADAPSEPIVDPAGGYVHDNEIAYVQARQAQLIMAFENVPRGTDQTSDAIRLAEEAEGVRRFVEGRMGAHRAGADDGHVIHGDDTALLANIWSNLGVLYNRGARFDAALDAYGRASALMASFARMDPADPVAERVRRDELRITVNRSRTLFLADPTGPDAALRCLTEAGLVGADAAGTSDVTDTQEWLYGMANAAYYEFQRFQPGAASAIIDRCRPYLRREVGAADAWIRDYLITLDIALEPYRTGARSDAFDAAATTLTRFEAGELERPERPAGGPAFDGYPRDRTLLLMNASILRLRALLSGGDWRSYEDVMHEFREGMEKIQGLMTRDSKSHRRVDDEPIASDTVAYLAWAVPQRIAGIFGQPSPLEVTTPASDVIERTEARFGRFMFADGKLVRLPMIMRGALILRSHPLAPLASELPRP